MKRRKKNQIKFFLGIQGVETKIIKKFYPGKTQLSLAQLEINFSVKFNFFSTQKLKIK